MHVKRHLSRIFGSFRLKTMAPSPNSSLSGIGGGGGNGKEGKMSWTRSLGEKVSEQLSISRDKNKTCSRWQLLDGVDTELESEQGNNWLSETPCGTLHDLGTPCHSPDRNREQNYSSDNLLNGQLKVPVLFEVRQDQTPAVSNYTTLSTNTNETILVHNIPTTVPNATTNAFTNVMRDSQENDWSLRVHSATRSEHKGFVEPFEELRTTDRILLDSFSTVGSNNTNNTSCSYNSRNPSTSTTTATICTRTASSSSSSPPTIRSALATLTKSLENDCNYYNDVYNCGDDNQDNQENIYHWPKSTEITSSLEKKEKKSSKLYRYASSRFPSFNRNKKKIGRSHSLRSVVPIPPEDMIKSIDNTTTAFTSGNKRFKLHRKVTQQEVVEIIKPRDHATANSMSGAITAGIGYGRANAAKMHQQNEKPTNKDNEKGFTKKIQKKLSIKALKKSGNGMRKVLNRGFAAVGRTMIHGSAVLPHPYESPPTSVQYDSYWGNDYHDYNTYKDIHYQLDYNRRRYSNSSHNKDGIYYCPSQI